MEPNRDPDRAAMLIARITQARSVLLWLMLAALATLIAYFAFRGYFSADLLFNFSNTFTC